MTVSQGPWLIVGQELTEALSKIDANAFDRLAQVFANSERRWFFAGQGRSGLSAQMAAMRFMHIGRKVHFVGEATAPSIRKTDGLLILSASGETPVGLSFARIAKSEGATVVALTGKMGSPLGEIADVILHVPVDVTAQFGGSLFEQCSLIILDGLILGMTVGIPDAHKAMQYRHTNLQ